MSVILFGLAVIAQPLTKEEYLRKSKSQKTWGWILTGGGAAAAIAGLIVTQSDASYFPSETVGPILIAGGGASIAGGIVLLSASSRNERKANEMNVAFNLKLEEVKTYGLKGPGNTYIPALSLSIGFK